MSSVVDASHAACTPTVCCAPALSLSGGQVEAWSAQGYLHVPGFLTPEQLGHAHTALAALLDDLGRVPPGHKFFERREDPSTLKQVLALHMHSEALLHLGREGPPAALAAALLGEGPVLQNMQYFSKPPRSGVLPTPPHQDSAYFLLEDPASAITLWLALDPVDGENGGVSYVPGSHLGGLLPHVPTGVLGFSRGLEDPSLARAAQVQVAAPGDLLVHHGLCIHGAGANTSTDRQRRALGFIYYSKNARVDEPAKAAYTEKLLASLASQGRV
jgi:phytanoyl-CoA hydroxylase